MANLARGQAQAHIFRAVGLTILQKFQEGFPANTGGSDQIVNHVEADLRISRDNQRSRGSWLFQFDVAALLPAAPISQLLEDANDFLPRQRGQAWHEALC